MRKTMLAATMLGAFLTTAPANAYTINDQTLVLEGHSRSDAVAGKVDVIGETEIFDVFGIDYRVVGSKMSFDLYTNFSGKYHLKTQSDGTKYYFYLADLAIDANRDGEFEYGVVLMPHSKWKKGVEPTANNLSAGLYDVSQWDTSAHFFEEITYPNGPNAGGGIGYGELYDGDKIPVVAVADGNLLDSLTITKSKIAKDGAGPFYKYSFSLDIDDLTGLTDYGPIVFWGGANCANDPITNQAVPEPASLLLMGIGLAGLAGARRKRKA